MTLAQVLPVDKETIDLTQFVTTAVDNLANAYSGTLLTMVHPYLFPALVTGIVFAGLFWLFDLPQRAMRYLWGTIIAYAVATWLLRYYDSPLPIIGIPFGQIFRVEGRFLSAKIDISTLNVFLESVSEMFKSTPTPNPLNISATIAYYLVLASMTLPEIALFVETSFAVVALGLGALLGPLFLAAYVFPFSWTKQLFWSWFHAMVKYAFYRVIAAALVFIWATAEMAFLTNLFAGKYTLPGFTAALLGLIVFNVSCLILCLRLPRLVADFTGGTAHAGGGLVGTAIGFTAARML